jgi:hypothetical protein
MKELRRGGAALQVLHTGITTLLTATTIILGLIAAVLAEEVGNLAALSERKAWFESLKPDDGGGSCCALGDCHRTEAVWRKKTNGWWAVVNGEWRPVPPSRVITKQQSIDGDAYVCNGEDHPDGISYYESSCNCIVHTPPSKGVIYCFVPPSTSF